MKMNTKRTIAITLTLLMTASAVGTLVSAAAVAQTNTSLTIYSTDMAPTVGESINIFGRLMNAAGTGYIQGASVQGQPITLNYSTDNGNTWQPLGTAAMSYYGGYSYTTTSSQLPLLDYQGGSDGYSTYIIQASFAGTAQYAPSSVTMTIQVYAVEPIISTQVVYPSAGYLVTNQPFTISGKVADVYNGKACPFMWVQLYAYNQWTGDYQSLSAQTNANGVYKFSAIELLAGYWQIDLYTQDDYNHMAGYNYVYVNINPADTQLTIVSGTAHPAVNKPFTVYGLLTNVETGARLPYEPQMIADPMTLTYSSDGGSTWSTWPTEVYTNGNGQYAFSVKFPTAGSYQIQVHFPGDLNYYASDSPVLTIQVG
ncbi:MAG: Ig-like domain-containing protein [Halobacteriota archaeon]|jgi:hypothetical protein